MRYEQLPEGSDPLAAANPGPDLAEAGYVEREYLARGTVVRYEAAPASPGGDGGARAVDPAPITTRVVVRAPAAPTRFSGVVVTEWLNVSSGSDAGPDWTYLADEIVRQGHAWVGVSAQMVGAVGGPASVGDQDAPGLRGTDPERYGALDHPGDAYAYDVFTQVGATIAEATAPLGGYAVRRRVAVGESQSAFALTSYLIHVAATAGVFDAYLVHSRGRYELGLGEPGEPARLERLRGGATALLPDDLDRPVIVVQTETDVVTERFAFAAARQPDTEWRHTWEIAGTAHADRWQIGEFEEFLGCPEPVNRGQQAYVLRAALRHLVAGTPPPAATPLELSVSGELVPDEVGNARGGVRTPVVAAPAELLSGLASPDASVLCSLFGATRPVDPAVLRARYRSVQDYLAAYQAATEAAIAAGFVLAEDREAVLAEARVDVVAAALA